MRAADFALLILCALCAGAGCTKGIGELCDKDRECEFSCESHLSASTSRKICTKVCDADEDCPEGSRCSSFACVVPCSTSEDCPDGSACWQGTRCEAVCRNAEDCVSGDCITPGDLCQ